ncbi:NUDIX hydrolase [Hyphomicrobium sp.]|uniref:NUDIX hydrolase n=1 Tax=Hyphomicrobium sp. TaxID=82 RepID=UPI002E3501B5|nr:NUDIX hydrolase [Hyphomicrobium sp.]HEX2841152.1 NUDIX hydrolase [Hyphomicrobium sp.]
MNQPQPLWDRDVTRVFPVTGLDFRVSDDRWSFADVHSAEIDAHWAQRLRQTPNFFNGTVHLLAAYSVSAAGLLSARFVRTDFKSFLYWRESGWPDRSVMDAFGSALIVSLTGQVLLGRQRDGNLNSGLCYPPSGFIDPADVQPEGTIDIEGGVLREVREETGLGSVALRRSGGYLIAVAGPVLSIAVRFQSTLGDAELVGHCARYIADDPKSELASVLLVPSGDAPADLTMPDYARALLRELPGLKSFA